jgi:hypothetical protein
VVLNTRFLRIRCDSYYPLEAHTSQIFVKKVKKNGTLSWLWEILTRVRGLRANLTEPDPNRGSNPRTASAGLTSSQVAILPEPLRMSRRKRWQNWVLVFQVFTWNIGIYVASEPSICLPLSGAISEKEHEASPRMIWRTCIQYTLILHCPIQMSSFFEWVYT